MDVGFTLNILLTSGQAKEMYPDREIGEPRTEVGSEVVLEPDDALAGSVVRTI